MNVDDEMPKSIEQNEMPNKLPAENAYQPKQQEIHPVTTSGDTGTASNSQKKRKTALDGLKDSLSDKEKVDGKRQCKPRNIDE